MRKQDWKSTRSPQNVSHCGSEFCCNFSMFSFVFVLQCGNIVLQNIFCSDVVLQFCGVILIQCYAATVICCCYATLLWYFNTWTDRQTWNVMVLMIQWTMNAVYDISVQGQTGRASTRGPKKCLLKCYCFNYTMNNECSSWLDWMTL